MTDQVTPEKAIAWLEGQLEGLGKIRNASTRDTGFRVWRQETLAFLQQIWPSRPGRWHRFRRVPFAPSSPRADEKVARETFERGFAEMRRLLKMWIAEIKHQGLMAADDPAENVEEAPKPPKAAARQKGPLKEMLGLGQFDHAPEPAKETPRGAAARPAAAKPAGASRPQADFLSQTITDAIGKERDERHPAGGARKASKASVRTTGTAKGATGILALADGLEALGVPAAERELIRASLIDLAQCLESDVVTWEMLQDAVALIMRYPALGRRALPLLQPYLDRAA